MTDFYPQTLEHKHIRKAQGNLEQSSFGLELNDKYISERRDRMDILLQILEAANEPVKKTHILYTAKINFYQLSRYLDLLLRIDMIEEVKHPFQGYKTTEKGRVFLRLFAKERSADGAGTAKLTRNLAVR